MPRGGKKCLGILYTYVYKWAVLVVAVVCHMNVFNTQHVHSQPHVHDRGKNNLLLHQLLLVVHPTSPHRRPEAPAAGALSWTVSRYFRRFVSKLLRAEKKNKYPRAISIIHWESGAWPARVLHNIHRTRTRNRWKVSEKKQIYALYSVEYIYCCDFSIYSFAFDKYNTLMHRGDVYRYNMW